MGSLFTKNINNNEPKTNKTLPETDKEKLLKWEYFGYKVGIFWLQSYSNSLKRVYKSERRSRDIPRARGAKHSGHVDF